MYFSYSHNIQYLMLHSIKNSAFLPQITYQDKKAADVFTPAAFSWMNINYFSISINSTSKTRVELGKILSPAPDSP